jgi:hypothetical protein
MKTWILPFFLVLLAGICPAQEVSKSVDTAMVRVVLDAIESNCQAIDSFDAEFVHSVHATHIVDNIPQPHESEKKIRYWYEKQGNKWRCDTTTVFIHERNGGSREIPYKRISVFDGDKTYSYLNIHFDATIDAGNKPQEDSKITERPYFFFGTDIRQKIGTAETFEAVTVDGQDLVKLHFENRKPEFQGYARDVWLDPSKGYNIKRAELRVRGKLASLYRATDIRQFGSAWIVTGLCEEDYSEQGTLLHKSTINVKINTYGKTIDPSVFHVDFPPDTLVHDNVEGKTYTVSRSTDAVLSRPQHIWLRRIIFVGGNVVLIGLLIWSVLRRTRRK